MSFKFNEHHQKIINALLKEVDKKITTGQAGIIRQFIEYYYSTVADYDLEGRHTIDLYGAALSHWNLFTNRQPNECKVRIFTPQYEQFGWQSSHTIIQIVQRDMPFLVDSIRIELAKHGITLHLLINPGRIAAKRDKEGNLVEIMPLGESTGKEGYTSESLIYFEIDQQVDEQRIKRLEESLLRLLSEVEIVSTDWKAMLQKAHEAIGHIDEAAAFIDEDELTESKDFINWIADDNFTFLGFCEFELHNKNGAGVLKAIRDTGLGLLRATQTHHIEHQLDASLSQVRELEGAKNRVLVIQQLTVHSNIHRPSLPYCIGVKRFDSAGNVIGEWRFVGLYTSIAYHSTPSSIPFLRRKAAKVLAESKLPYKGHSWKTLVNILETLPRDELFQMEDEQLFDMVMGIFYMQERSCIRLFLRKDAYNRFYSCLVYIPKEQYNSPLRLKLAAILCRTLHGQLDSFDTYFSESILARIHYVIKTDPESSAINVDERELEQQLILASRHWRDDFKDALFEHFGEAKANHLFREYGSAFPTSYREMFSARLAIYDIEHMESLNDSNKLEMSLYNSLEDTENNIHFKLFCLNKPLPLSDVLPTLENMGLRILSENSHQIMQTNGRVIWISDFKLVHKNDYPIVVEEVRHQFQDAFARIWYNEAENDGFNQLVLSAALTWREVSILRGYAKYLRQVGFTLSQTYIESTLTKYVDITKALINLFHLRFDPKLAFSATADSLKLGKPIIEQHEQILLLLDSVDSLDEDKILRRYVDLIMATVRTNYYQRDEHNKHKSYISYKLRSADIPEIPLPLPLFEVFVYSPRVEAVHLRTTRVARGGIRWSDRKEDFRTEVLGLMKAQQVKNSVIVPSGAKGGFFPKCLPINGSREETMQEVISSYSMFIRGLLDLTDNREGDMIVAPKEVVCHDEEDVYLVVAADKGTATFSDIANSIAIEYGFWLGDAFASGGSMGYDHKKIGITAKGAWESVKRHFRDLHIDINKTDFTVVGIGDMSGDVFGNAMILSQHIKLVAAFNHQHIFIDPNPDPRRSFQERERLFNLPRSSWTDYDVNCISEGGGVFNRSAKTIKLKPVVCELLDLDRDEVTVNELIQAILKARVDMIWNGGIGTYIKSSTERSIDVGDRANDLLRVNGSEVRAKVIGEGGNLGVTQLGRVEYCLNGGLCNTDFIDNVGGVDCSDHEVNIKILLDAIVKNGDLTDKQRNSLLADMTEDVADLVIRDCYSQTEALSLIVARAPETLDEYRRYITTLENAEQFDRALNYIPDDKALGERKANGLGLMCPELSVLLAYSKIYLKEDMLETDVPEDEYLAKEQLSAFPERLAQQFPTQMAQHRLRREIIATQLSNMITNKMGPTFVRRLYDETGASTRDVVRCFIMAKDTFAMGTIWSAIEKLDDKVDPELQMRMMTDIVRLLRRGTRWFLRSHRSNQDIATVITNFSPKIAELHANIRSYLVGEGLEKAEGLAAEYQQHGVPEELAWNIAIAPPMVSALDVIEAATMNNYPLSEVAQTYFALGSLMQLDWFRMEIGKHPVRNNWDSLARAACKDELDKQQRNLTDAIFRYRTKENTIDESINFWMQDYRHLVDRWYYVIADLKATTMRDFSVFAVALRELSDLAQASQLPVSA